MEYGAPIYLVINASEITEPLDKLVKEAIKKANDLNATLYLTVNSGKPPIGPPPPGGGEG
jgi:hypothetical protein